jgi:phage shock protein A
MGLMQRLGDIFRANWDETLEGPTDMGPSLQEAVRQMEAAVVEARRETSRALAQEKVLARSLAHHRQQVEDWQRRAERAVQAGDDEAARRALLHRQEWAKMVDALEEQTAAAAEASQATRQRFETMQQKLDEVKRQLGVIVARQQAVAAKRKIGEVSFETSAFAKYERISDRVEQAEAEAEALRELEPGLSPASAVAAENDEVEAALAQLKRAVRPTA